MNRNFLLTLLSVILFSLSGSAGAQNPSEFKDSAALSPKVAAGTGLMQGFPDGTFRPQQRITRGEFAVILARLLPSR